MVGRNQVMIFELGLKLGFVLNVIMVVNLAMFIGPAEDILYGSAAGFLTGAFWVYAMLDVLNSFF
jgi:hypothetical protein